MAEGGERRSANIAVIEAPHNHDEVRIYIYLLYILLIFLVLLYLCAYSVALLILYVGGSISA